MTRRTLRESHLPITFVIISLLLVTTLFAALAQTNAHPLGLAAFQYTNVQTKTMEEAKKLNAEVLRLFGEGRYDNALPLAERALALLEKELGTEHPSLVAPLVNLGSLYLAKKDAAKAEKTAKRALTLLDKSAGTNLEEAQTRLNLAFIYRALDAPKQAELLYRRALELLEKHLGTEHLQVGGTLIELADLALLRKEYSSAEPLYRRALSIAEKQLGADHPQTAQTLRLLADLYRQQKQFTQAEPLYRRALAIMEEHFGANHQNLASLLNDLGLLYVDAQQYGQAVTCFQRALKISEQTFGMEHVNVIGVLNNLANLYHRQGEPEKALRTCERALAIAEKIYGKQHSSVETLRKNVAHFKTALRDLKPSSRLENDRTLSAENETFSGGTGIPSPFRASRPTPNSSAMDSLLKADRSNLNALDRVQELANQTHRLHRAEKYNDAIVSGKAWLAMAEKHIGAKSLTAAFACEALGKTYLDNRDFFQAEPYLRRALDLAEKIEGKDSPNVLSPLHAVGELYLRKGDYKQAEPFFRRALVLVEKSPHTRSDFLPHMLWDLASVLHGRGDYKQAEQLWSRSVQVLEQKSDPILPLILLDFSSHYEETGEYEKAEPLLQRAVSLMEQAKNKNPAKMAQSLIALAIFYQRTGNYLQADLLHQRAVALIEKALGVEHEALITPLVFFARFYCTQGQYEKAEPVFRRVEQLTAKLRGPEHIQMGWVLGNYARLPLEAGDYLKAEALLQRALSVYEKVFGIEHDAVVEPLAGLGSLYRERADYSQSEQFYQRAIATRQKALGPEHPDLASLLNDLALVYKDQRQYDRAEQMLRQALALKEKIFGPDNHKVANTLDNLAKLYQARKIYDQAEALYQRALAIRETTFGAESDFVVATQQGLAELYKLKGDYAKAEPLYQRAIAHWEKKLGTQHTGLAGLLNSYARLCSAKGDIAQATKLWARSNELSERHIGLNLATGSERQKQLFLGTFAEHLNDTLALHLRHSPDNAQALRLAVTTVLRNKGRTLDVMADSSSALRRRLNPQDRVLLDELGEARSQLSTLVLRGPGGTTATQHQTEIKKLEGLIEKLEAEITTRSARLQKSGSSVGLAEIQAALPPDTKLVEFTLYRPESQDTAASPRYVAYVIGSQGDPVWVELGEAPAINRAVAAFRQALGETDDKSLPAIPVAEVKKLARALDEKVMEPVRKLLGTTRTILLSPDGALNLVPFAALVDEQQRYLAEQYTFSYLTSGRDLLRLQAAPENKLPPLIIANPDFDLLGSAQGAESASRLLTQTKPSGQSPGNQPAQKPQATTTQPPETLAAMLAQITAGALPATADEAQAIKALLPGAVVLTGPQATEAAIKQTVAPSLLHIATHGFFLEDSNVGPPPDLSQRLLLQQVAEADAPVARPENPLLRSGLILAGFNQHRGRADDGVLTAMEAASLNLWGTQMVILSACDTGVGEVKNGDGVYGLRRALVLAGSETQVMSLWPVSDKGTQELMVAYYKGLLAKQGRSEALRQVQLQMMASPKRQHPYYWASFIVSGEWANLDGKR